MKTIIINPIDNVAVALEPLKKNEEYNGVRLTDDIPQGHKFALKNIAEGEQVLKYGNPIGKAKVGIKAGAWVHTHNIVTNLTEHLEYRYSKAECNPLKAQSEVTVNVYERKNGDVGIRNELWIIPTVGCVNAQAKQIAASFIKECEPDGIGIDGVFAYTHPYGCSQLGGDHERTKKILRQMVLHPNTGGVLVLGLGCENNSLEDFKVFLGDIDTSRIKFLKAQEVPDEITAGVNICKEIYSEIKNDKRVARSIGCLKIGLKCGGSDGMSGITANPLLGAFSDYITAQGGVSALTEVPEMFGAEHLLMARAQDENVFNKTVGLISDFKDYFTGHGVAVYENPSPGNKEGGITTLEDKSLGCTQKSGAGEVVDVVSEGESISKPGLNLVNGPGNDIVAVTNLGAAGCHMVLFTTGRGTPLGGFVPTVKVASNNELSVRKSGWIDFDASRVLTEGMDKTLKAFIELIAATASGKFTKNELSDCREIAIFKTGVTL